MNRMQKWKVTLATWPNLKAIRALYPSAAIMPRKVVDGLANSGIVMVIALPTDTTPAKALSRFLGGPSAIVSEKKLETEGSASNENIE